MPRHARRKLRRTGTAQSQAPRRAIRWARLALVGLCLVSVVVLAACADIFYRAVSNIPSLADPAHAMGATSIIYDHNGDQVTTVPSLTNRQPVDISQVPSLLQDAFIATEDRTFYTNLGISFRGIARAALVDLTHHAALQGASTISQQLARNLYLSPRDTITRKLKEAALAIELNRKYTKPQILDMYLNEVPLGEHAFGIEAASETYFNQSDLSKLTLPQLALLAGLPQAPSAYDPFVHPNTAMTRRNEVLGFMAEEHYITDAQAKSAEAAPLGLNRGQTQGAGTYPDPWFVDAVIEALQQAPYNLTAQEVSEGGLKIYTTLDPTIEAAAVKAVHDRLSALSAFPKMQAAEVVLQQSTGDVVAIVGGAHHTTALAFDRAVDGQGRQPGSSIKPLVDYIPALENHLTAGTVVDDTIHAYGTYLPKNDQLPYYGLTTLTEALRRSVNTVAVQILNRIGVQTGFANAVRMGLPLTRNDLYLPLAIGGTNDCCTPLAMADAYATIANGGMHVTPRLITKVVGPSGQVIAQESPHFQQVVDPRIAFVMTKMLETVDTPQTGVGWDVLSGPNNSNWGTGCDATVCDKVPGWPTAGKTGTTDNDENAWYVGYTPLYTAAVWMGYDIPTPIPNMFGDTFPGPIFRETMTAAVAGHAVTDFPQPAGVLQAPIDIKAAPWTVAKPGPLTPAGDIRLEWFVAGTQPTDISPLWVQKTVDSTDPQTLWQNGCSGQPETRTFLNRTSLGAAWAKPIAYAKDQGNWQQFLPLDMSLYPPTQACSTPAPVTPPGGGTPGGSTPGCATTWSITLNQGQAMSPLTICAPKGQTIDLTFIAGDGQPHQVQIGGYNLLAAVPADGTPVTVSFVANRAGAFLMEDTQDPTEMGRLVVQGSGP